MSNITVTYTNHKSERWDALWKMSRTVPKLETKQWLAYTPGKLYMVRNGLNLYNPTYKQQERVTVGEVLMLTKVDEKNGNLYFLRNRNEVMFQTKRHPDDEGLGLRILFLEIYDRQTDNVG